MRVFPPPPDLIDVGIAVKCRLCDGPVTGNTRVDLSPRCGPSGCRPRGPGDGSLAALVRAMLVRHLHDGCEAYAAMSPYEQHVVDGYCPFVEGKTFCNGRAGHRETHWALRAELDGPDRRGLLPDAVLP